MSFIAAALITSAIGAGVGIYGANKAASAQKNAANQQAQTATDTLAAQREIQAPFTTAGTAGVNELARQLGVAGDSASAGYGSLMKPFDASTFQTDPGYAFRLAEGNKALEHSAAARGGLLSGQAMKGAMDYGQNMASNEYQNAFNRYTSERDNRYNQLLGLTNVGTGAAGSMTSAAGTAGANTANAQGNAGAATASGYVGGVNAINGGLNNVSSYFQNKPLNDMLTNMYARPITNYNPQNLAGSSSQYGY